MPYLGALGSNFEKLLLYLKSAPSNLSHCLVWCRNKKFLNLGLKMLDLCIFGLGFENNYFIFEINALKFV